MRNSHLLGPCSRTMPRDLWRPQQVGAHLIDYVNKGRWAKPPLQLIADDQPVG